MLTKELLYEKLDIVKGQIPKDEWALYHLQSTHNFILHLDSIKSICTRTNTTEEIDAYLKFMEQKYSQDPVEVCTEFRRNYIRRLSRVYKDEAGFIAIPDYTHFTFLMAILLFALKSLTALPYVLFIITVLTCIYIVYTSTKIRGKKYYLNH